MSANSALAFVFSGISLSLLVPDDSSRQIRRIAFILASLVELVGLGTLCEYVLGLSLGIDQLLFHEPASSGECQVLQFEVVILLQIAVRPPSTASLAP